MSIFDDMKTKCAEMKEWEPAFTPQIDRLLDSVAGLESVYVPAAVAANPSDPFFLRMETSVIPTLGQLIDDLHASTVGSNTDVVAQA